MVNIRTYKCKNQHNLSPVHTNDFDYQRIKARQDPSRLYLPRLNAVNAIKLHVDSLENAASFWLRQNGRD